MRCLINYDPDDAGHLQTVAGMLKKRGVSALATNKEYGMADLLALAKSDKVQAQAILCAHEGTLGNLVKAGKKKVSLGSFRGSRLNFSTPVVVINHLSHVRTVNHGKWLMERDLDKLQHIHKKPIQLRMVVCETPELMERAVAVLAKCLIVSIDIETTTFSRISCISFTGLVNANTTVTYVIPFIDFGKDHWEDPRMYALAILAMQRICKNPVPKMMFNDPYDAQYLIAYHAEPENLVLDVMGMAHSQFSELPKTLDFTTSIHCWDYLQWKHEADSARQNSDIRAYWYYCAKDSWNTLRCFLYMLQEYPDYAVRNYQMVFKLIYPALYCAFEGVLIDNEERLKKRADALAELEKRKSDLQLMTANPNFNPGSPKQVAYFLFEVIGAKRIRGDSTDEKVMKKLALQHPLVARICDDVEVYRGRQKEISTYYDFLQLNNRLVYSLGPFATDTARFSSRAGNFFAYDPEDDDLERTNYGTQIQNMPDYAKSMVIADIDYELFEADNNKSEARCVAEQANCPGLQVALGDIERDFYKILGGIFFGIKYEEVTKELRNKVLKKIIHGTNYMMGVDTFIDTVGVLQILEGAALLNMKVTDIRAFVKFLLGIYHKKFPEVGQGYKETKLEVMRTKKLVSEMGYTRYFFGDIVENHKVFRNAVAHRPQNLSVSILNKGFWRVYQLVLQEGGKLRLKAQIHDSIFGQYRKGMREYYQPKILECMNNPVTMPKTGRILTIPVDFASGATWKEVKGG